ncbi:MAG: alpha/beta hydrolase [Pseudomonadota bacterium]
MFWIVAILGAYLFLCLFMFFMQRNLLYPASKEVPRLERYPDLSIQAVETKPEPGITLTHWFRPPRGPNAAENPVVVLFHGNAGHIGDRVDKHRDLFEKSDYGILLAGYRGYGGNSGKPTEAGLLADARSALDWLAGQGISPERTVILGESLGSAVATQMAAERPLAALVLEAPPSSIADVAQSHYWYLPARWLLLDQWKSTDHIAHIDAPLLILHGGRDNVVPQKFGRRLFEAAVEPKEAFYLPEGQHSNLFDYPQIYDRFVDFIERTVKS